jgi:hypothetical protein
MATATLELEEMTITYDCYLERCDYGVARSPVWYEPQDIEITQLEIMGEELKIKDLAQNPKLYERLLSLADDIEHWK